MNLDLEKTLAKVSGENVDKFAARVVSNSEKAQIDFAFEQLFSGLSLLEWVQGGSLGDAWKKSLDKMRDFIFSINQQNYVIDYLRMAVFEYRTKTLRMISSSGHLNEQMQHSMAEREELKKSAAEKIKTGTDIIKNILSTPHDAIPNQANTRVDENILQKLKEQQYERSHEHEREREKN